MSRSRTEEARLVERARIVLSCLSGRRNDEIASDLGVQEATVGIWRRRFAKEGFPRLKDRPRSGKPPVYDAVVLRQKILGKLEKSPPEGFSGWDGKTLAEALGVSDDVVWRVLRKEGVQLRRHRSWCVSTDPEFTTKATQTKKRPDFQAFMDDVVADTREDQEIHVILDNCGTHKKNHEWLEKHPNVHIHFTPASASWLNQVEIWLGIFTRKTLRGASFESQESPGKTIAAFVEAYNQKAAPFVWHKREVVGSQLKNTIVNLRN